MATPGGGMAFQPGISVRLSEPPATLRAGIAHLASPDPPLVTVDQEVEAGDPLTRPDDPTHARLTAPFDATVTAVQPRIAGDSPHRPTITLAPIRTDPPATLPLAPPRRSAKPAEWLAAINRLGPWHQPELGADLPAQLYHAWQHDIDAVVCVGLDSFSPYPVRSSLLESFPEAVATGTRLLGEVFGAGRIELLCADDLVDARPLHRACKRANVRCKPVDNVYPDAHPTLVVYAHGRGGRRHRMLPRGANPATRGMVLVEPWHAVRLGRWLANGAIDLARPYFVGWANPAMPMRAVWAFPGQPLAQLDEGLAGPGEESAGRAIVGHPMTGEPSTPDGPPAVTPDDAHLITLLTDPPRPAPSACIHCGWCSDVCPTRLEPIRLAELAQRQPGHPRLADRLNWCIDCGLCSYVCPSHLPLAQTLRGVTTAHAHAHAPAARHSKDPSP